MKIISSVVVVLLLIYSDGALAERHDRRQNAQRARIRDGVQDGSLTRGEAARARAGQRQIRRFEKKAEADGTVSADEAAKLEKAQDRQSRRIHRMKHNEKNRSNDSAAGNGTSP